MADDEQFSLCWNNFNSNLSAGFHESLCRGDLVDVTLAAEGQFVKAHRLVLSVCSPYFRKMFTQMPANQHAFVFLKDVSHTALKDLIQFMYCGEVNVKQEALPAFISTAEALQIKGLTDSDPPPSQSPAEPSTPTPQLQQIVSPRVRQRTSTARSYKIETVDDSGDDIKQPTQIVIQTTAAPTPQATIVQQQPQQQHHLQQSQQQQQIASSAATTTTTTAVVTQKRPAQRSVGSAPHIKRTKSTIDPLDSTDTTPTQQHQQITVQTAVVTEPKPQIQQQQQSEPEYIDLPIELPTKSEPDYADETGEVETGEHETTYVEDDSYGDLRYDESYFTENEDAANTTSAGAGGGNTSGTVATTSKAIVKQQTFSDSSYVETVDPSNNDAQVAIATVIIPVKGKRGRPKLNLPSKPPQEKIQDKIASAIANSPGQPTLYVSTTKGSMKLLYDGHHFRYSFRKGQYSIFQCCYKENKEECKVRVVSDQKRVFPLDGEHVHYIQATDKSVTAVTFEPGELSDNMPDEDGIVNIVNQEQFTTKVESVDVPTTHNTTPIAQEEITEVEEQQMYYTETGVNVMDDIDTESAVAPNAENANDFREKIKKRLQKALLGKKK